MAHIVALDHEDCIGRHDFTAHTVDNLAGIGTRVTDLDVSTSQYSDAIDASLDAFLGDIVPVQTPSHNWHGEANGHASDVKDITDLQVHSGWGRANDGGFG